MREVACLIGQKVTVSPESLTELGAWGLVSSSSQDMAAGQQTMTLVQISAGGQGPAAAYDHQDATSNIPENKPVMNFYLDHSSTSLSTSTLEKSQQKHLII